MWVSVYAHVRVRARTGMQTREEHVSATGWWERCPRTPPVKRQEPSQFGRRQKEKKENRAQPVARESRATEQRSLGKWLDDDHDDDDDDC